MMAELLAFVLCLALGGWMGYQQGKKRPDWHTRRDLQNDAARRVLAELTEGSWICAEKLSPSIIVVTRDLGRTSVVVSGIGVDRIKVDDQLKLEMGSGYPYDSISSYRMKFGEILKPVRIETSEPSGAPAKRPFNPIDSLVRSGCPG